MTLILPVRMLRGHLCRIVGGLYQHCSAMSGKTPDLRGDPSKRPDHIDRTADNTREETVSLATVMDIKQLSATVKGLQLKVHDRGVQFKAGQWVDMMIPGVQTVGGFSMTSSPLRLREKGVLELAVKLSRHPPAAWVHHKCQAGDEVSIRVGGDFHFSPQPGDTPSHLLLLAGGVGINPLMSILHHVTDLNQSDSEEPVKARLLFSAGSEDQLIFKDSLLSIQDKHHSIKCQFFVTKERSRNPLLKSRRITREDLQVAVADLDVNKLLCYVCGPSPMIKSMEEQLLCLNVSKDRIMYEQWW